MKTSPQKLGGLARARSLAPSRRQQIARRAARARWKKVDPREILDDPRVVGELCRGYGITRLYVFGSILTRSFSPTSDVDLLYERARPFGYGEYCDAVEGLENLLGRGVDLVNRTLVVRSDNEFRRREILGKARKIYDASQ
jgi:uncharacterized protein